MMMRLAGFLVIGLLALGVSVYGRAGTEKAKLAEDGEARAKAEPPFRTVPLGEGQVLECAVFPMRSFDDMLLRCTFCREQDVGPRPKPPLFSCTR